MKNKITGLWVGSLLVSLAMLASGCKEKLGDKTDAADAGDSMVSKVDKHGEEVMASTTKAEARAWMKQPKHVFFKADAKDMAKFVEDFYNAGAEQVLIADIEEQEGAQYGEGLLVVLPKEAAARAKVFEVNARAETAFQEDPVTDQGQKYLYYSLD